MQAGKNIKQEQLDKKKTMESRNRWADRVLGQMSPEHKVGQLMVFGFCGPVITPDTVELIRKYHVGGLRISQLRRIITLLNDVKPGEQPDAKTLESMHVPYGLNRDCAYPHNPIACTAEQYAAVLNQLRDYAMENNLGVGLHFTIDQEGNGSDDLLGGQRLFPSPMGMAAGGDPELAYRVALGIGLQARAVGANMIHSPVLDVNTNPKNPEIGTRAYADNAPDVTRFALESLRGFQEAGLIATGKHFPGRGESEHDAHWGLPTMSVSREVLWRDHLAPYQALIKAGLPAVMMAHCCYPALGVVDKPASLTRSVVTDLLRGELGFEGVITTDNMMMGGILKKYEMCEAIVQTLIAGCSLVLSRDESTVRFKIIETVLEAVRSGRLPAAQLDDAVLRILKMRWDMGLAENSGRVDPDKAGESIDDPFVVQTAHDAAMRSILCLRNEEHLLPLKPNQRVLLIEQVFPTQAESNNMYSHPGLLWQQMCELSDCVASVEINNVPTESDRRRVMARLDEAEVIVMTNYYHHKAAASISDLVRKVMRKGKQVIVIANSPYEFSAPRDFATVLVTFAPAGPENLQAVAEILYGRGEPTARLPVQLNDSVIRQDKAIE